MYEALLAGLSAELTLVRARPEGADWEGKERRFASNGMSVCLERGGLVGDLGVFEVATPECEGPEQLGICLRAIDSQLVRACERASRTLEHQGFEGRLSLVKNSRDADGAYYGRQENLEVEWITGWRKLVWWIGLTLFLIPLQLSFLWLLVQMLGTVLGTRPDQLEQTLNEAAEELSDKHARWLRPPLWLIERIGFARVRGPLEGFLVSRQVVTGTGWTHPDGSFTLSEKGAGITRWWSRDVSLSGGEHAVFATGNLMKLLLIPSRIPRAFASRQRLQLGLADSNRCELAELVGVTGTARVVELAESGALADAPRFHDPVAALKCFSDPTLRAQVTDRQGRTWTALELQRYYQGHCAAAFPDDPVVAAWGEVLDDLGSDPTRCVGRVDWVTKRYLLEQCAEDASWDVRKRIDIGYHELGEQGLYDRLMAAVEPTPLVADEAVRHAWVHPPEGPASHRATLITRHGEQLARVDWGQVQLRDQVIFLRPR